MARKAKGLMKRLFSRIKTSGDCFVHNHRRLETNQRSSHRWMMCKHWLRHSVGSQLHLPQREKPCTNPLTRCSGKGKTTEIRDWIRGCQGLELTLGEGLTTKETPEGFWGVRADGLRRYHDCGGFKLSKPTELYSTKSEFYGM